MTGVITGEIQEGDSAAGFSCGKPELDRFFAERAYSNDQHGFGKTFVLRSSELNLPSIIGYYTLSMTSVSRDAVKRAPRQVRANAPRYIPVALMGRLAVETRAQGRKLGEALLLDAFRRVLAAANTIGCAGVLVDAKDSSAVAFYTKYGFVDLDPAATFPRSMLIAMATVAAAIK